MGYFEDKISYVWIAENLYDCMNCKPGYNRFSLEKNKLIPKFTELRKN